MKDLEYIDIDIDGRTGEGGGQIVRIACGQLTRLQPPHPLRVRSATAQFVLSALWFKVDETDPELS